MIELPRSCSFKLGFIMHVDQNTEINSSLLTPGPRFDFACCDAFHHITRSSSTHGIVFILLWLYTHSYDVSMTFSRVCISLWLYIQLTCASLMNHCRWCSFSSDACFSRRSCKQIQEWYMDSCTLQQVVTVLSWNVKWFVPQQFDLIGQKCQTGLTVMYCIVRNTSYLMVWPSPCQD